jgi:hypothetical protein
VKKEDNTEGKEMETMRLNRTSNAHIIILTLSNHVFIIVKGKKRGICLTVTHFKRLNPSSEESNRLTGHKSLHLL